MGNLEENNYHYMLVEGVFSEIEAYSEYSLSNNAQAHTKTRLEELRRLYEDADEEAGDVLTEPFLESLFNLLDNIRNEDFVLRDTEAELRRLLAARGKSI